MYGHETDSVFTDEETQSFASFNASKRVLSDPNIHQIDENEDLYVNLSENLSLHSRQTSQNSLVRPKRGDTIAKFPAISTDKLNLSNGTLSRKKPVPTPRTILKVDRMIRQYSQFVIDPNGPDDYCPVCNKHLDEPSGVQQNAQNTDMKSVVCLTSCQHKVHLACLKWTTPEMSSCLKCPTCGTISGSHLLCNILPIFDTFSSL